MRAALVAVALAPVVAPGCSTDPVAEADPVCAPLSIRACQTDACAKGAQQCGVEGLGWTECNCTILDASFDAPGASDAESDAPADAAEAGSD